MSSAPVAAFPSQKTTAAVDRIHPPAMGIAGIQILRGIAAGMVLVHHVLEESQSLLHAPASITLLGAAGVDVFFVVSGFIMLYTSSMRFGIKDAPTDFFVRRLIRIAPLYWLCTLIIVAAHATGTLYRNKLISAPTIALSLLFLPNHNIVNGVGWTLNFEMYFYVVFALYLRFCKSYLALLSFPAITLFAMLGAHLLPASDTREFLANPIALEFGFGLALAVFFLQRRIRGKAATPALLIGIVGIAAGAMLGKSHGTNGLDESVRFLFWGLPAAALVCSALFVRECKSYAARGLLYLGDASYSVYLTHGLVMTCYARVIRTSVIASLPPLFWPVSAVAVSLAVGLATFQYIERPINDWLKAQWKLAGHAHAAPGVAA